MASIHLFTPLPFSPKSLSSSSIRHWQFPLPNNFRFSTTFTCHGASAASHMESQGSERPRFKDFPYAAAPIRDLMMELVSTVENRLESQLLPCTLPSDVEYYQNQSGTSHGSLFSRSGAPPSPIDHVLGSWLHSELLNGGALNITSLICYMNDSTDAPQLVIEFIQTSPSSLVLILDLAPRKDLVINPEYLKTFYEDTELEKQQQLLYKIPEIQPYFSPSLYVRCVFSPTAALVRIDTTESGGEKRLEEILRDNVSVAAKQALGIWLELCACGEKGDIGDEVRAYLKKRDHMFKNKTIEIDLGSSLPRLFGQEIADRVLGVLRSL